MLDKTYNMLMYFWVESVYCLQFYVCLGPESPLDER